MTTLSRRSFLAASTIGGAALFVGGAALAREPEVFQRGGVAVNGTDVVAYFTESRPVAGSSAHRVSYNGATWQFASAENAAAFEASPARYAPQYGGYCAWAAAQGYIAPTIPEAWTVHQGRLYLNANRRVHARWSRDIPGFIAAANANWPGILG